MKAPSDLESFPVKWQCPCTFQAVPQPEGPKCAAQMCTAHAKPGGDVAYIFCICINTYAHCYLHLGTTAETTQQETDTSSGVLILWCTKVEPSLGTCLDILLLIRSRVKKLVRFSCEMRTNYCSWTAVYFLGSVWAMTHARSVKIFACAVRISDRYVAVYEKQCNCRVRQHELLHRRKSIFLCANLTWVDKFSW